VGEPGWPLVRLHFSTVTGVGAIGTGLAFPRLSTPPASRSPTGRLATSRRGPREARGCGCVAFPFDRPGKLPGQGASNATARASCQRIGCQEGHGRRNEEPLVCATRERATGSSHRLRASNCGWASSATAESQSSGVGMRQPRPFDDRVPTTTAHRKPPLNAENQAMGDASCASHRAQTGFGTAAAICWYATVTMPGRRASAKPRNPDSRGRSGASDLLRRIRRTHRATVRRPRPRRNGAHRRRAAL
jgi:hypothetical protein